MKRVFLIHGWEGTPDNHWFPWLKVELVGRGFQVFAPAMPNANHPQLGEWLAMVREWVGKPDLETFFVGHSLGCMAIVKYLEQLATKTQIGGAVFVAGFSNDLGIAEIKGFFESPVDFEKVKTHLYKSACIFSDNDKYVSLVESFEFGKRLGAKTILEKGKGHFMKSEGVEALTSVFQSLIKMSS